MKKVFAILVIAAVVSACGGKSAGGSSDSASSANQTAKAAESDVDTNANKTGAEGGGNATRNVDTTKAGGKLIAKNDCLTCHKIDTKVIGPSYADVAAKYPSTDANIDTLANKVIKGGKGHWGDIQMAGHPTLSEADAKTMVKYILSLKK